MLRPCWVVIPPGQNILLDVSPPRLNLILVSGRLTVEDTRDVTIDASYIFVQGRAVQVDPMKFTLQVPGSKRLKL